MAGSSLLTLLDDIATVLDDVAVLTKVATRKTAGVLGDDLALNAEQVSGVRAERELPVVWAVAKGSAINKLILVPAALAISAFAPWAVTPLLMAGGLFLCYEGFEKIAHKLSRTKAEDAAHHAALAAALADPAVDLVALEKQKIKGAIRTDFVLSAEIIVITLGIVADAPFVTRVAVMAGIAALMTVGVYGLVAGIVKLDDAGLHLSRRTGDGISERFQRAAGAGILRLAPYLMKTLSIAGTAAMFLVGGGILTHGIPVVHHWIEGLAGRAGALPYLGGVLEAIGPALANAVFGIAAGALALAIVSLGREGLAGAAGIGGMTAAPALGVEDFDYVLPSELIAQHPTPERTASRLMRFGPGGVSDHAFADLSLFLSAGDVLVFNDTRVVKARLHGVKDSGGKVEVLIERALDAREALAQVRASHAPQPGGRLRLAGAVDATVIGREGDLFRLRFDGEVLDLLERHGAVPLPPYITHAPAAEDEARYQTVYARAPGAVAAPTAGLHFDAPLMEQLRARGVELAFLTLHVGAGTFQPVRTRDIAAHRMHAERYEIPAATVAAVQRAHAQDRHVVAVGTTSLRALESSARGGELTAGSGETDLFITPGYRFRVVDRLITNFHLPKSTLLMLVAAFAGIEPVRAAYRHAIAARYRFFSYGDAMLVDRQ